jgi:hypothetical protein
MSLQEVDRENPYHCFNVSNNNIPPNCSLKRHTMVCKTIPLVGSKDLASGYQECGNKSSVYSVLGALLIHKVRNWFPENYVSFFDKS